MLLSEYRNLSLHDYWQRFRAAKYRTWQARRNDIQGSITLAIASLWSLFNLFYLSFGPMFGAGTAVFCVGVVMLSVAIIKQRPLFQHKMSCGIIFDDNPSYPAPIINLMLALPVGLFILFHAYLYSNGTPVYHAALPEILLTLALCGYAWGSFSNSDNVAERELSPLKIAGKNRMEALRPYHNLPVVQEHMSAVNALSRPLLSYEVDALLMLIRDSADIEHVKNFKDDIAQRYSELYVGEISAQAQK